ncbi:MAG: T9SS type A sorting domain-containing protein [candidate division WOR-3 bacterium]
MREISQKIDLNNIPPNNARRILKDGFGNIHFLYSKNDSVYDYILNKNQKLFIGKGKNPAISQDEFKNLYCIFSYNDTTFLEELRFSKFNGNKWENPLTIFKNEGTYYWGIGAPCFEIFNNTGYLTWETKWGPTHHPPPGYYLTDIRIWGGNLLMLGKFDLRNLHSFNIFFTHFVNTLKGIKGDTTWPPRETLRVHPKTFYDSIVPLLISPSLTVDYSNRIHLLWEGANDILRYYCLSPDTIKHLITLKEPGKAIYFDPYITKSNSFINLVYVKNREGEGSKVLSRYTFQGFNVLSNPKEVYSLEAFNLFQPFIDKNYITFVKNEGSLNYLVYGENVAPFDENILFSYYSILSPQFLSDGKYLHFVFYAGDSLYRIYYIKVELQEEPPIISLDFGNKTPDITNVYREGYISFGPEYYKNVDYGDSLIYEIPLVLEGKFKIRFEGYSGREVDEKIYVNNIPLGVWHIEANEYSVFEKRIPERAVTDLLRIKVKRQGRDGKAVLGALKVYVWKEGEGGPQDIDVENKMQFDVSFPTLLKENSFLLIVPEKGFVKICIYDISGRKRFDLKKVFDKGFHSVSIPELSKGIYFIKAEYNNEKKIKKILRIK